MAGCVAVIEINTPFCATAVLVWGGNVGETVGNVVTGWHPINSPVNNPKASVK